MRIRFDFRDSPKPVKTSRTRAVGDLRVRLEAEPSLKSTDVIERFVNHRQPDDLASLSSYALPIFEVHTEQHRRRSARRRTGSRFTGCDGCFILYRKENHNRAGTGCGVSVAICAWRPRYMRKLNGPRIIFLDYKPLSPSANGVRERHRSFQRGAGESGPPTRTHRSRRQVCGF